MSTLVGKHTTFIVVFLAQNEANYRDPLFNKMVQQTTWQANLHVYFRRENPSVVFLLIFINKHVGLSRAC